MKKLAIAFLLLAGCNSIDPEPRDYNLEDVEVVGGPSQLIGDVSLMIQARGLSEKNKWSMVWEVDGIQIASEDLSGISGDPIRFQRYEAKEKGDHIFTGCLISGNKRICNDRLFSVR